VWFYRVRPQQGTCDFQEQAAGFHTTCAVTGTVSREDMWFFRDSREVSTQNTHVRPLHRQVPGGGMWFCLDRPEVAIPGMCFIGTLLKKVFYAEQYFVNLYLCSGKREKLIVA
jgi:hypothetical protein